ncbi:hypothetical protein [Candidatus Mycoplasma haematohominis]|uniref:hypothetical protein n=1 Tax=Candidatus Mycoplasma haematohominis TaxID=1494318 RepID=UPI001C0A6832|nr:hypothetical protein [Candidatus Mycoplasma haemohominis]
MIKEHRLLFSRWFTAVGVPTLVTGSVGGGIKLYFRNFDPNAIYGLSLLDSETNQKPKKTFLEVIQERKLTPISDQTQSAQIQTVLLHRLDAHLTSFGTQDNEFFEGSKKITLEKQEHKIEGTSIAETGREIKFELQPWKKPNASRHKQACTEALKKTYDEKTDTEKLNKLIKWCTVIDSNRELLTRSGFRPLDTTSGKDDDHWRKIIAGGWLTSKKNENDNKIYKYWEQQAFFDDAALKQLLGEKLEQEIKTESDVKEVHINLVKEKCKVALNLAPKMDTFPLSTFFHKGIKEPDKSKYKVDNFFEAAFFCVEPMKAEDYIKTVLHANVRPVDSKDAGSGNRICSIESTQNYDWYTYQPAEGKGFWCGVRELYAGHGSTHK